jgi:RepB plasmid partitioning protein/ParB-like nuclease domain
MIVKSKSGRSAGQSFEAETRIVAFDDIQPLHLVSESARKSQKFRQVESSIHKIGLVEPPVVVPDKDVPGKFLLLDGHLRLEVLRAMGRTTVECLIAKDDEAFTYNKRVSRIATIQEHRMIIKAIEDGVPEEMIAETMSVNVAQIRLKKRLLKGICPEVIELLQDRLVPQNTFGELRKMVAVRQVEAAQLMIAMNKFSINYARSLVGATPKSQLVDSSQPKHVVGLSDAQMALMEQESASLDREFRLIEKNYGADNLDLVVASGYVGRLLSNARIVRYLAQRYPELLSEFQKIVEPTEVAA